MSQPQKKPFSLKIQAFSYVTAVVTATVFVVYYLVFAANTTIGNNISTSGTLTVSGASVFSSTLLVSGAVNASSTLQATGNVHFYGNLTVDGTTNIAGLSFNTATVTGNFWVGGDISLAGGDINLGTGLATTTLTSSGGFLGIGTTSPSQLLSVHGNAFLSGSLMNVANITATGTLTVSGTGSSSIATALGIASTSPWGTFSVEMGTVNPSFVISNNGSSTPSLFIGGVNQNGRIGIGTSTPQEALSVVGNISNIFATSSADSFPKFIGSTNIAADPYSVYVSGQYAYVVSYTANLLQIFNVSTSSPALVGSVSTGSGSGTSPNSVYVAGQYAYVVTFSASGGALQIYDVSNVSSPVRVGSVSTGASARYIDVKVSGKYAYVTDANLKQFLVFDVSRPTNPSLVGSMGYGTTGDNNGYIAISGRYAYVTNSNGDRLVKFDISSSTPALIGSSATGDLPTGVSVSGNYAYVVNTTSKTLQVFNISTSSPALVSTVNTDVDPELVYVSGRYAYVTNYRTSSSNGLLQVFDISNPLSPVKVGSVQTNAGAWGLFVAGRYAYVTSDTNQSSASTLEIFDISGIETTSAMIHSLEVGNLQVRNDILAQGYLTANSISVGSGGILSKGPLAAIGSSTFSSIGIATTTPDQSLTVVGNISNLIATSTDLSVPPMKLRGSASVNAAPNSVYVSGRYAYVVSAGSSDTLQIFDVSTSSPALVSAVSTGDNPQKVFVASRYAYVVNNTANTLQIFDVSNPSAPVSVSTIATDPGPYSVYVSGRYAYVGNNTYASMNIFDVSNPLKPVNLSSIRMQNTSANVVSIFVSGRYAYVLGQLGFDELDVFDISDPAQPFRTGVFNTDTSPRSVYISGRYAYIVASGNTDFAVVDISNPAPVSVSSYNSPDINSATDVFVSGRYAYVIGGGSLVAVDISNPVAPASVGYVNTDSSPTGVFVAGRYAYVVNNSGNTLQVFDISGIETTSAMIHSLEAGNLQVRNDILAFGQLQVNGGLTAGINGIFSAGALTISATTSKSILLGGLIIGTSTPATTSPNFSQFQQSTVVIEATSSESVILTLRGSGSQLGNFFQAQTSDNTNLFLVNSSGGFLSSASSTVSGSLSITGVLRASSTATSTFAGGIKLIGGCLQLIDGSCAGSGLSVGGAISGGTGNRVLYENSSNQIAESANLTFNGATLTVLNASTTGALTSTGGFISSASSTFANALQIAGPIQASSSVTIANTLGVTGLSNLSGLISSASSTFANALQIAGPIQASSSVTISSTLGVSGLSTLAGFINTASSTQSAGNFVLAGGSLGIGTTSPYARLSIKAGAGSATRLFSVASSSDDVYFEISSTGTTTIDQLQTGIMSFDTNAGAVTWIDMPITSGATYGTVMSYQAMLDASSTLTIYGQSDGAGGVMNQKVGIGTSTPWAMLSVERTDATTSPMFVVSSNGSSSPYFIIANNGYVGINGTTSPGFPLSVVGNIGVTGCVRSATSTYVIGPNGCSPAADIAESYVVGEVIEPGDVVALAEDSPMRLIKANQTSKLVVGAISTSPAVLFEGSLSSFGAPETQSLYNVGEKAPLALAGRIPVKVNLNGGEIKAGDPIAASSESGISQKATTSGKIIGYALENFTGPTEQNGGKVLILVSLGHWQAPLVLDEAGGEEGGLLAQVIALVKQWLESMQVFVENGLVRLKELVAEKITVQQLCVENVCVNSAQLQTLLNNAGLSSPPPPPPAPAPSPDPEPEPEPEPTPLPQPTPPTEGGE